MNTSPCTQKHKEMHTHKAVIALEALLCSSLKVLKWFRKIPWAFHLKENISDIAFHDILQQKTELYIIIYILNHRDIS